MTYEKNVKVTLQRSGDFYRIVRIAGRITLNLYSGETFRIGDRVDESMAETLNRIYDVTLIYKC